MLQFLKSIFNTNGKAQEQALAPEPAPAPVPAAAPAPRKDRRKVKRGKRRASPGARKIDLNGPWLDQARGKQ